VEDKATNIPHPISFSA